jgi:acetolactate synthase-1/2/3 large subunit
MKASDLLIRCLENEGVEFLFGLPGEEILDVMEALRDSSRIRFVEVRHEQGGAFMADVYGRLTGRAGVCLSTLGPGATNLLTGVADAHLDRAPLVAMTGQASQDRMHKESHQYIDVLAMFKPVSKWSTAITKAGVIPEVVRKAFKVAQTEKPGATHLELPEDVMAEEIGERQEDESLRVQAPALTEPLAAQVQRAVDVIAGARRPVILAGNGVVRARAHAAVRHFARSLNVPVVHTFMGKGVLPDSDPLSWYTLGLPLRDYTATQFEQADVVIAVGYDFVEYAPCFWNPDRDKRVVHVDVSPAEVDAHYIVAVGVLGNPALSLERIGKALQPFDARWARDSRAVIAEGFEAEWAQPAGWPLRPQWLIRELRAVLAPDDIVVCDVGAHKLWMARMFPCEAPNTCLMSNGFAAMGIGLPGAVAAKLLFPDRKVVAVTGDGGFLMNAQELETAVRVHAPIVVLVWRDDGYGVIRWKQQVRFGRTSSVNFGNPDLVAYAKSFGACGYRVSAPSELKPVLEEAFACGRPAVIDCPVDYGEHLRLADRLKKLS